MGLQPAATETGAAQSLHEVGARSHQPPDKVCPEIFDHQNDWPLVDSVMPGRSPTAITIRKGGIKSGFESIRMIDTHVHIIKIFERRQNYFGREWQRCDHGPRRQRAVIRTIGHAARDVIKESSINSIDN